MEATTNETNNDDTMAGVYTAWSTFLDRLMHFLLIIIKPFYCVKSRLTVIVL